MEPLCLSVISFGSRQREQAAHSPFAWVARPNGLSFESIRVQTESPSISKRSPSPISTHNPTQSSSDGPSTSSIQRRIQSSRPFKPTGLTPPQPSPPIASTSQLHGHGSPTIRSPSPRPKKATPLLPPATPSGSKTGHISARCNPALLVNIHARPSTARLPLTAGWTGPSPSGTSEGQHGTAQHMTPLGLPSPSPSPKPSPEAAAWYREGPPPASAVTRKDTIEVIGWIEEQQSKLKESVGHSHTNPLETSLHGPIMRDLVFVRGGGSDSIGGFLDSEIMEHQEELLTRGFDQLCLQVGQSCVERGYAMHQTLMAIKTLMRSLMNDRDHALRLLLSVEKELGGKVRDLEKQNLDLKSQLYVSNQEREISQLDMDRLSSQLFEAKEKLLSSRSFSPLTSPHPLAKVADMAANEEKQQLEEALKAAQTHSQALSAQMRQLEAQLAVLNEEVEDKERDLGISKDRERQLERKNDILHEKLNDHETEAKTCTPRPQVASCPPFTSMTTLQTDQVLEALRLGCSAEDMHRLLTYTSPCGKDITQWSDRFGCIDASGGLREAKDEPKKERARGALSRLPSAKKAINYSSPASLMAGVNAAFGGGSSHSGTNIKKLFKLTLPSATEVSPFSALPTFDQLFSFLVEILASKSVDKLKKHLSGNELEDLISLISVMMNIGLTSESIALILMGKMSRNGLELWSYKSQIGGILKGTSVKESARDIILNLSQASQSTQERMNKMTVSGAVLKRRLVRTIVDEKRRTRREGSNLNAEELLTDKKKAGGGISAKLRASPSWQNLVFTPGRGMVDSFIGLGSGDEVPAPLRYQGTVVNRRWSRQESVEQCQKLWAAWDAEAVRSPFVSDFLPRHLKEKHGRPQAAAEFIYSLVHSCTKHLYCPNLNLFLKVILGEVEDTVRDEHQGLVASISTALSDHETLVNQISTGWLSRAEFKSCLSDTPLFKKLFSESQLRHLWESLEVDEELQDGMGMINYEDLLEPDGIGLFSAFVDSLLDLLIESRLEFFTRLEDSIRSLGQQVTPQTLASAISSMQGGIDQAKVVDMVSRVFGGKEEGGVMSCSVEETVRMIRVRRLQDNRSSEALMSILMLEGPKKSKKGKGTKETKKK